MNLETFISNFSSVKNEFDKQVYLASTTAQVRQSKRIFEDGLATDNTIIGKYSTKAGSFAARGKKKFYKGGYAEFKRVINKSKAAQSGNYDLTLTRETRLEFVSKLKQESELEYVIELGSNASKKMGWNKERTGKEFLSPTESEVQEWAQDVIIALENLLNGR